MSDRDRKRLKEIQTFPALVKYLREDLGWPVEQDSFDDLDDITFDWEADELGIDPDQAAKIEYIKQLRPLEHGEPQGVFFVKFDTRNLPVVALRRLLSKLVVKKRASAGAAERPLWQMRNLVFISSYGESDERQLSFAYFQEPEHKGELPSLKVLGWDAGDTPLHLDRVHDQLEAHLAWPENAKELPQWRKQWSAAFELRHGEVVTTAKQLAEQLATLARGIRERANQLLRLETETGPLRTLMAGFKKALIHDLTEDQFADMYAQTIAYGLLSARITHPDRDKDPVKAETLPDLIPVTNPFLKELMETFVVAGGKHRGRKKGHHLDFDELGINDVVELLRRANMDAVLRNFGADDRREDPVTYFYEDFLNAYDAQERKRRGVYYTPKPVVSYIVRSVHELLQTEFGIEDGLASTITWGEMATRQKELKIPQGVASESPFVQILDPATGTATFLVTVIEVIYDILSEKWKEQGLSEMQRVAAWNAYVPKHLLPRLYGYELMMAPYTIAHLKIGLKLFETGYRFGSDERAGIYLTNALEAASDARHSQIDALSPALAHEADAVNAVKRAQLFTIIVGNPPYSGVSANMTSQAQHYVDRYKFVDGSPLNERKHWLQDDYVKFIGFAQSLVEAGPAGIVGLITNHAFLDNTTFRGMRQSLSETFQRITVYDLHGSVKKSDLVSENAPDDNVFDIQQGVAISIAERRPWAKDSVRHGELRGSRAHKYTELSHSSIGQVKWTALAPFSPYYFFVPKNWDFAEEYENAHSITEIMPVHVNGIVTARDGFVIDFEDDAIIARVQRFLDPRSSDAEVAAELDLSENYAWRVHDARISLRKTKDWRKLLTNILYRPFDIRRIIYHEAVVWRTRADVMQHMVGGRNIALCTNRQVNGEFRHAGVSRTLINDCTLSTATKERTYLFPLFLSATDGTADLLDEQLSNVNVSEKWLRALAAAADFARDGESGSARYVSPQAVLDYVYAVLNCPEYRHRYAEFLRVDFPRIPLPGSGLLFKELARLGGELVALHLLESPKLDKLVTDYSGPRNPEVGRVGWSDETVWLDAAATKKGQPAEPGTIGFHGVPEAVWNFHIGGYQVCEKWLKDRKGRKLGKADIEHYQKIVVAISETIRIMKQIDEVIEKHGGWPGAFRTGEAGKTH